MPDSVAAVHVPSAGRSVGITLSSGLTTTVPTPVSQEYCSRNRRFDTRQIGTITASLASNLSSSGEWTANAACTVSY